MWSTENTVFHVSLCHILSITVALPSAPALCNIPDEAVFIISLYLFQCSFYYCSSDVSENEENIEGFQLAYGIPGHNYTCLYNPDKPTDVILETAYSSTDVFHILFWNLFFIGVFLLAIIVSHIWLGNCLCCVWPYNCCNR